MEKMDIQTAVSANTHFGIDLLKTIVKDKGQENVFISPFSISSALAMTHLGAKEETARGMEKGLRWPTDAADDIHKQYKSYLELLQASQDNFSLSSANRVYIQKNFPILKEFIEKTMSYYLADAVNVDFAENAEMQRVNINNWVEEKTQNKIKDLIAQGVLDAKTRMVLINAIHFKGNWDMKFRENLTRPRKFKLAPGKEIDSPSMVANEKYAVTQSEALNCRALELPYKGKDLSMVIILPTEDFGLQNLIQSLTQENLAALFKGLSRSAREKIDVRIPKFEVTSSHSLKQVLSTLGMTDAFCDKTADFSGMTGSKDLVISEVIHKAFVKVDEEGTEAAAATAVVMRLGACAMAEPPKPFIVDHPFLFLVRDNRGGSEGTILFIGAINDPSV